MIRFLPLPLALTVAHWQAYLTNVDVLNRLNTTNPFDFKFISREQESWGSIIVQRFSEPDGVER
jgi:hypothetical protein